MKTTSPLGTALLALLVLLPPAILGSAPPLSAATEASDMLADFESRTTVHRLENGWTFLIVERPVAPVFSFATYVDVGSAQEVPGITGLAHMFEHMAFKGTPEIGTDDWESEKVALEKLEHSYLAWQDERLKEAPDAERLAELRRSFEEAQEEAAQYVVGNEFADILNREGATGLNAGTGADQTVYFYSLPINKFELFAYLESERFRRPVFREFYKERDVVQEERRMRTESQPIGRLIEQTLGVGFIAHPYGQPTVGWMSDLQSFTATDAKEFYETWYAPSNMVTAIVGQVEAEKILPVLEAYFGRVPAGPEPPALRTVEPPQNAERTVVVQGQAQPIYAEAYHRPSERDPDHEIYLAIHDVLSNGRTSRLHRSLVQDRKIAAFASAFPSLPGSKYPHLWGAFAVPVPDASNDEIQAAIREELDRLREEPVTDAELARFRVRAKADLLRQLRSNVGIAIQLAAYQTMHDDWRELFRSLDRIDAVSAEQVQRVARQTFVATNRIVARLETQEIEAQEGSR